MKGRSEQEQPGNPAKRIYLDWRHGHVGKRAECVHCGGFTNLRDDLAQPSHKTCAEAALERDAK